MKNFHVRRTKIPRFNSGCELKLDSAMPVKGSRKYLEAENGGDTFLRNVGSHKIYTALHPRRRHFSFTELTYFFPFLLYVESHMIFLGVYGWVRPQYQRSRRHPTPKIIIIKIHISVSKLLRHYGGCCFADINKLLTLSLVPPLFAVLPFTNVSNE
jgi:hypothetical protein